MKVSICIPAYNQTAYLKKTLNSILDQDFIDYEIIITDDTPDDSVKNLIDEFDFRGKLRYFKNQSTLGTPENWNEAIRKAQGQYIKIIHHDDFFTYYHSLKEFVRMLDENPDSGFAFSSSLNLDKDFQVVSQHSPTLGQLEHLKKSPDYLFFSAIIGAPSATIYRNNLSLFFDNSLKWFVDMDFYIRILKINGEFIYNEKPLISTVDSPLRVTHECLDDQKIQIKEMVIVLKKITSNGFNDLKFARYLSYRMMSNGITSIGKLKRFINNINHLPFILYLALFFSKIYYYLFRNKTFSK